MKLLRKGENMSINYVGIDIGKKTFFAAVEIKNKVKIKSFDNTHKGFSVLMKWLADFGLLDFHFCVEATGKYGDDLAYYLYKDNHIVSGVNPAKIKFFSKSQLTRNKTDSVDAKIIMQYCRLFKPSPWKPLSSELQALDVMVKRIDTLNQMLLQENNRLEKAENSIKKHIERHIKFLKDEIKELDKQTSKHINKSPQLKKDNDLLNSIPGIGCRTAHKI